MLSVNVSFYLASRYAFPRIARFLPSSSSFILPAFPYSFNLKFFVHSQTPNANNIDNRIASFNRLLHVCSPPSILQITKILGSIAKDKHSRTVISLFAQAEFEGFTPRFIYTEYLDELLLPFGSDVMGRIHKMGHQPDAVTLNTLIKGLCIRNQVGEALDFYDDLMVKGFQLNEVTYRTLVNELCKLGKIRSAIKLVQKMERHIIKPTVVIYNTIIGSLCRGGHVIEAHKVYSNMIDQGILPDIVTYNSLLHGSYSKGQWKEASQLLHQMVLEDIKTDVYTFNVLIGAFCKEGMIKETQILFSLWMKLGERPNVVTYNSLMHGHCMMNNVKRFKGIV